MGAEGPANRCNVACNVMTACDFLILFLGNSFPAGNNQIESAVERGLPTGVNIFHMAIMGCLPNEW